MRGFPFTKKMNQRIELSAPLTIPVQPGQSYRISADNSDLEIREPRTVDKTSDPATWDIVHGSPIADGAQPPLVIPMTGQLHLIPAGALCVVNLARQ